MDTQLNYLLGCAVGAKRQLIKRIMLDGIAGRLIVSGRSQRGVCRRFHEAKLRFQTLCSKAIKLSFLFASVSL